MRKLHALLSLTLLGASSAALGQSLPLNTGFNHSTYSTYTPLGTPDNYWIKIATFPASTPGPAFTIPHPFWQAPLTLPASDGGFQSTWIGPTASGASPTGQISYAIFRKCFCLTPRFQQPKLNFKIMGDDMIGVWLNNGNILPLQGGAFNGPAISGPTTTPKFQTGRNCLYVLVVDTGSVVTGFNLAGTVSAYGLMPMAAAGTAASFKPCTCEGPAAVSEQATINAIVKVAKGAVANGGTVQVQPEGAQTR